MNAGTFALFPRCIQGNIRSLGDIVGVFQRGDDTGVKRLLLLFTTRSALKGDLKAENTSQTRFF